MLGARDHHMRGVNVNGIHRLFFASTMFSLLTPEPTSLLGRGLYALQLQPWLEAFGREQIKVLFLEEVVKVRRDAPFYQTIVHPLVRQNFTSERMILLLLIHDIVEFLESLLKAGRFLEAATVTLGDPVCPLLSASSLTKRCISLCFSLTSLFKQQSKACSSTSDCHRLPSRTRSRRTGETTRRSTRRCRNDCGISTPRTMRRYVSYWTEILCRGLVLEAYRFLKSTSYVWCELFTCWCGGHFLSLLYVLLDGGTDYFCL